MEDEIIPYSDYPFTEAPVKIYSKKVIWVFSIIFSTIFGGVLLMYNLIDIGKRKEAALVLGFSVIYTFLAVYISNIPEHPKTSITYLFNFIGGAILTEIFFKKHFSREDQYQKKKIWKPLIISILISLPFIIALIYNF